MGEKRSHKLDYNCLMLKFDIPNWSDFITNLIKEDDVYNTETNSYGLEHEPHVTLLFGIHDYVKLEDFKNILVPIRHIKCKTNKISSFQNDEYDVVKFDIDGNYLHKLNKDLRDTIDYTTSFPDYKPHMTIFYSKKGSGKKYEKTFSNPILIKPVSYLYSYSNGKKEEFFV